MARKKNTLKYALIAIGVLLVLLVVARKAGWIGEVLDRRLSRRSRRRGRERQRISQIGKQRDR